MTSSTVESCYHKHNFIYKRVRCACGVWILLMMMNYYLILVASCWGGGGGYYYNPPPRPKPKPTTTTTKKPKGPPDDVQRNLPDAWGGFEVPRNVKEEWYKWLNDYKKRRLEENKENSSAYDKFRGPGSGWPHGWHGIGGGFAGFPPEEPPPWSYAPINVGLPLFCYDPPQRGNCNKTISRFAFNVYIERCVNFTYSGCGGNQNNFLNKLACEQACLTPPDSGCDPKTDIKIEDYTITEDRRRNMRKCGFF